MGEVFIEKEMRISGELSVETESEGRMENEEVL
jgi:hypothetical protein